MKRMFYAAHTPSSPSRPLSLSLSPSVPPPPFPRRRAVAVSLVGQNTYRTYRLLPAAFPVILSGHRWPARELLLTCMHVAPTADPLPALPPSLPFLAAFVLALLWMLESLRARARKNARSKPGTTRPLIYAARKSDP